MKRFFPNMETGIIFLFLICLGLWGMSRCKKKKDEAALSTTADVPVTPLDTGLLSPAASKIRIAPKQNPPNAPVVPAPTTAQTPQYAPTNVPMPTVGAPVGQPTNVPESYGTTTSPAHNTRQSGVAIAPNARAKSVPAPVTTTTPQPSNTMLYVLINGLNIRAKADLKAKSKGKLKLHEQVYFLEEATEQAQTVRLANGASVTKPWFKIQTKRGTVGWVHGSGVDFYKRKPTDGL